MRKFESTLALMDDVPERVRGQVINMGVNLYPGEAPRRYELSRKHVCIFCDETMSDAWGRNCPICGHEMFVKFA